jgi:transposase
VGVEIGRATLDGWVMRVGELLGPIIVGATRRGLLAASYLQADETPVPVAMVTRMDALSLIDHDAASAP